MLPILLPFLLLLVVLLLVALQSSRVQGLIRRVKPVPYDIALGRATWLYLHAIVDHFPSNATIEEKREIAKHIEDFSKFYPCLDCRKHMCEYVKENPVRYDNKAQLVFWLFTFHNTVNKRLHKTPLKETEYMDRLSQMGITNVSKTGQCSKCQRL